LDPTETLIENLTPISGIVKRKEIVYALKKINYICNQIKALGDTNINEKFKLYEKLIEGVGSNKVLIAHVKSAFGFEIAEMENKIALFKELGLGSGVNFGEFYKVQNETEAKDFDVSLNKNNITFSWVKEMHTRVKQNKLLNGLPFHEVVKAVAKSPLEDMLEKMGETKLLELALDLVCRTAFSSQNSGTFWGFTTKSHSDSNFKKNSDTEFDFPPIFLDLILEFLKKKYPELYLWKQREKVKYYALENTPFLVSDYAFVKIKLYEIGNKNNNPKPKLLTLPFSLQTLLGIECIPFESVKVELLHQRSQLISKRDGVPYLQKHIWNRISANGTWQQFVPLAPNQFGFESILIIGDMIFVFQMKYKSQFEKKTWKQHS